jgi:hypothetical protein
MVQRFDIGEETTFPSAYSLSPWQNGLLLGRVKPFQDSRNIRIHEVLAVALGLLEVTQEGNGVLHILKFACLWPQLMRC